MPGTLNAHAEHIAKWLRGLAEQGKPCPNNLSQSIRIVLGCSRGHARDVKAVLVTAGRLIHNPAFRKFAIDGQNFALKAHDEGPIEAVKMILRRKFALVVDARTVDQPLRVAAGEPEELILGTERVPFDLCKAMAAEMVRP